MAIKQKTPLKYILIIGFLLFGLISLIACSSDQSVITPTVSPTNIPATSTEVTPPTTQVDPVQNQTTSTPEDILEDESKDSPAIQYQLNAILDYYNHLVEVYETIVIPHPANVELVEVVLIVPPNAWPNAFSIQKLISETELSIESYSLEGVRLTILLEEPWLPGNDLILTVDYKLVLPVQNAREGFGPSPFGYTTRQTNLVDWYPMVPPYQEGTGWIIHDPWIFGEYLVYPAANYQVILENTNSPYLVVAASSDAIEEGSTRSYSLDQARNFVFSISPDYQILESEVDGTKVLGYVFSPYLIPGQAAFETTKEALSLYSDLFGPYGQPSISMVQADFNHGMEYEGLYFQSRGFFDTYSGSERSYLVMIAAHETAHQWWYGQIANNQALEPWLDEALCTYSELVYYENLYPESINWWWSTRVNYYEPYGVIDRSIYGFSEFPDQYLAYRNATYLQGAKFINDLRNSIGDEDFLNFLRDYLEEHSNQIASGEDFFASLRYYLDLENSSFIGDYFSH